VSPDPGKTRDLIWATRGRSWGFRFLLDGGLPDPLPEYERLFAELDDAAASWRRVGETVAVRFPDPRTRRDASGRVIPHEFVVFRSLANDVESVADALRLVWPVVKDAYARVWDADTPPSVRDLHFTT
jgi:hypothetical protein